MLFTAAATGFKGSCRVSIAKRVSEYLGRENLDYDVVRHPRSQTSDASAELAHVSGDKLAKGVVLKDNRGYVLAIIPASHVLEVSAVGQRLRRPLEMASEAEITRLFPDCEAGAVPVVGSAYGLNSVVEECLIEAQDVYFEAGDHESLVHVQGKEFKRLIGSAPVGSFSHHKGLM